jgi:LemA protein
MKKAIIAVAALGLAVLAGIRLQAARDALTRQQEAIRDAWTRVDTALTQRSGMIPDIAANLGRLAPVGVGIRSGLAEAREALDAAHSVDARIQANAQLDGALAQLLVELASGSAVRDKSEFVRLYDELAAAEDRIAVERRKYNEAIQKYNTSIELFPGNLAAAIFGFTRSDAYFKTMPTGRRAPAR